MPERERQILVAGVGNSWLQDDGFGSEVVKRLGELELPAGVPFWTSAPGASTWPTRSCAGYDALLLVDVSKQGGEPGTLYVIDPRDEEIKPIDDGETVNPHGMDPHTVAALHQDRRRLAREGHRRSPASPPRSRRWDWSSHRRSRRPWARPSTS